MSNFWKTLQKPFFVLAPMINVTDAAFRAIIAKYGKPDAFFTEFTSVDGLCSPGKDALLVNLQFSDAEKPVVMQVFGNKPEYFVNVGHLARELGFAGLDINMGCPDRAVLKQGSGAALIKNPELATKIVQAAKEGAGDIPVSVKTRLGFDTNEVETWIPAILKAEPAALTVHGRTKKELSEVPAHWDQIKRVVEIRNELNSETLILGNGDVLDLEDAHNKVVQSGVDGVMLGRAVFGNPWLFHPSVKKQDLPLEEILRVMQEHADLFEELFGAHTAHPKNFLIMRKHFGAYVSGFPRSRKLRARLMEVCDPAQLREVIAWYLREVLPAAQASQEEKTRPQTWRPTYPE